MPHLASSTTALSAPGKVLLSGGYLVLDRNYTGTVFALDARIHVVVQQLKRTHKRGASSLSGAGQGINTKTAEQLPDRTDTVEDNNKHDDEDVIVVRSPQFVDAVWEYGVERCDNGGGVKVVQKGQG